MTAYDRLLAAPRPITPWTAEEQTQHTADLLAA